MTTLLSLAATNWMGFRSLSLKLANRGLVLLCGDNDAGKSSIGEAITYAITGSLVRPMSVQNIIYFAGGRISREGSENGGAKIVLEADKFRLELARSSAEQPTSCRLFNELDAEMTGPTVAATRQVLSRLMLTNALALGSTFILLQPESTYPMFVNAGLAQRFRILSEIVGMSEYEQVAKVADKEARAVAKKRELLHVRFAKITGALEELRQSIPTLQNEVGIAQRALRDWGEPILPDIESRRELLTSQLVAIDSEVKLLGERGHELADLPQQIEALEEKLRQLREERIAIQTPESTFCVDDYKSGDICPLCLGKGTLTEEVINERQQQEARATLKQQEYEVNKELRSLQPLGQEAGQLASSIKAKRRERGRIEEMLTALEGQVAKEMSLIQQRTEVEHSKLLEAVDRQQHRLTEAQARLTKLLQQADEVSQQEAKLQLEQRLLEFLRRAHAREIPVLRLKAVRSILSELTSQYLLAMRLQVPLKWDIQDEGTPSLSLSYDTVARGNGINRCIALAVTLALGRVARRSLSLRIFDETIHPLRGELQRNVLRVLAQEAKQLGTIILIPQGEALEHQEFVDEILMVKRRGNVSTLEEA